MPSATPSPLEQVYRTELGGDRSARPGGLPVRQLPQPRPGSALSKLPGPPRIAFLQKRPGTAAAQHVIHPFAADVIAQPAPSSTASLLATTRSLAAAAPVPSSTSSSSSSSGHRNGNVGAHARSHGRGHGGGGGFAFDNKPPIDLHSAPFRSLMDNSGGWSKLKTAQRAFILDASATIDGADAAAKRDNDSGLLPGLGLGGGGAFTGIDDRPSTSRRPKPDPLLDLPFPPGVDRDPIVRAMLRLQRARVLSAAHAQAAAKEVDAGKIGILGDLSPSNYLASPMSASAMSPLAAHAPLSPRRHGPGRGSTRNLNNHSARPSSPMADGTMRATKLKDPVAAAGAAAAERLGYSTADLNATVAATARNKVLGKAPPPSASTNGAGFTAAAAGFAFSGPFTARGRDTSRSRSRSPTRPGTSANSVAGMGMGTGMLDGTLSRSTTRPNSAAATAVTGTGRLFGSTINNSGGGVMLPQLKYSRMETNEAGAYMDGDDIDAAGLGAIGMRAVSMALACGTVPSASDIEGARAAQQRVHADKLLMAGG